MITEEKIKEAKEIIEAAFESLRANVNYDAENGYNNPPEGYCTNGSVVLEYLIGLTDMAEVLGAITEKEGSEYIKRLDDEYDLADRRE